MLKFSIAVAAALLGTAAIAQDANMGSGASTAPAATAPATSDSATSATTPSSDANMTQGSGTVSSTPDMSPTATTSDATPATPGATKDYPRCSRTVTDSCIQGGHRSRRHS
jgi:hypothetical protein